MNQPPQELQLVDTFDVETQEHYWRAVNLVGLSEPEMVASGAERLLHHDRPWSAVDVLASAGPDGGSPDRELIERVLLAAAESDQVDAAVHAGWEVGQLLDVLEAAGVAADRLAGLEFIFFAMLDDVRAPRALHGAVAESAELFVTLVRHGYRRADDADEDDVRPELAGHAWNVLRDLRRLPGTDDHGNVDGAGLLAWVQRARELLAEADRADIGDIAIGELLARSAPGQDGIWPAEAVRDAVEQTGSARIVKGLAMAHYNSRGTTIRDPYAGGEPERALAEQLRADATGLEARWPRTARMLRDLADDYERDADRLDGEAQRRSDEG
jgi:hypothetical protein